MSDTNPNASLVKQEEIIADKIRRCLQSEEGKFLVAKLRERQVNIRKQLQSFIEPVDIFRAQGHLTEIDVLLSFGEES